MRLDNAAASAVVRHHRFDEARPITNRRAFIRNVVAALAALSVPRSSHAAIDVRLPAQPIPRTGEPLPVNALDLVLRAT